MNMPPSLAWLVDEASHTATPELFLGELGRMLLAEGIPVARMALTLAVPHPIIAQRTWLWRAAGNEVIEALGFGVSAQAGREWLAEIGNAREGLGSEASGVRFLGFAGSEPFRAEQQARIDDAARFAKAPLAAISARLAGAALLEAYLGRRSAARVGAGALKRGTGETIRAALLCADLRDFTAMSESAPAETVIAALDAWFERVTGAVNVFGGEVLKFIGDGVLAIFPVTGTAHDACAAAIRAANAAKAGMKHLNATREGDGLPSLPFGMALHFGEIFWGNIGAADRLDFTAIGPAVNLVSRLEGLCKPLGHAVLVSGALAAEVPEGLVDLGSHTLRGIAELCPVFALGGE
jgi:class 3 adenylate cyclase